MKIFWSCNLAAYEQYTKLPAGKLNLYSNKICFMRHKEYIFFVFSNTSYIMLSQVKYFFLLCPQPRPTKESPFLWFCIWIIFVILFIVKCSVLNYLIDDLGCFIRYSHKSHVLIMNTKHNRMTVPLGQS